MKRERATKIIRRIVETIEAGQTPAPVRELYVFGSYARGGMEPNDLDLVVVHDPPPRQLMEKFKQRAEELALDFSRSLYYPSQRFRGAMSKALRKPGEAIDLLMGTSFKEVEQMYSAVRDPPPVLLWSVNDREVEQKLACIKADPSAGRAPRPGFMTAKEAGCTAEEMKCVAEMLDRGMIEMKRWTLPDEPPALNETMQQRCNRWTEIRTMGKKSLECLPYALRWLQDQRVRAIYHDVTEISDEKCRYHVRIGPMALYRMLWRLEQDQTKAVCLIPHFKRSRPREAFEFKRGHAWRDDWRCRRGTRDERPRPETCI